MTRTRLARPRSLAAILLLLAPWSSAGGAATDTADLGHVEFPNSGSPAAQEPFVRGVLLLHSFEYDDAAEAFRAARAIDPGFALAYWGEAMTHNHPLWRQQDRQAALAVLRELAPTPEGRLAKAPTERERGYLAAVETLYGDGDGDRAERAAAYAAAMGELAERYPEDLEAKAFHALAILGTAQGERDVRIYMRAAAQAEEVFAADPRHPGAAHYLIHSYDDPVHAPLGLRAARVYADIAPAASHAQHMISHIYVALGRWADSIDANVKSFEVSVERAERKGLGPDARNYHALHWLHYSRLQLGQLDAAWKLTEEMAGYAAESDSRRARGYLASFRAGWTVETGDGGLPPGPDPAAMGFRDAVTERFARGWAALAREEPQAALAEAEAIAARRTAGEGEVAESGQGELFASDLAVAEVLETELRAAAALARGDGTAAVDAMDRAAAIEGGLPMDYGPPAIVKPSHELLGEMLLALGRPAEAQGAFSAGLERAPRRRLALAGLATAARAADDAFTADRACAELVAILAHADDGLEPPAACAGSAPSERAPRSGAASPVPTTSAALEGGSVALDLPGPLAAGWRGEPVCELLQEDARHRLLSCAFAPGSGHERHHHAPHAGYTLAGGRMQITDGDGTRIVEVPTAAPWTSDGVAWHEVVNVGDTTAVYLLFEPRCGPTPARTRP